MLYVAACFYYSGLVALARWRIGCRGPYLVILNYHRASEGDLRSHLLYLRRYYRILHAEAALEELYGQRKNKQRRRDRHTALVLTFDDGYRDNYTHAFALAHELQIPFTIYLLPGYIESGEYFWWSEGKRLVGRAEVDEIALDEYTYHLCHAEERTALARVIDARLRSAQSVAEREDFLTSIRARLGVPSSTLVEDLPSLPLTWKQILEMEESGWVSFGAHTMGHPILAYLTDKAEIAYEVATPRIILDQQLGHPIRTFAYPVGQLRHISDDVVQVVKLAGYDWACTTRHGFNTRESNPYLLKRIEVDVDHHWLVVAAKTAGLWGFLSRLRWNPFVRRHFTNAYSV